MHYDAIVVGGGFSGAMAAMAMAREGLSVLLAEKSGSLGGAATVNYVLPFMEYRMTKNKKRIRLNRGLFSELLDRLNAYHALDEREVIYNEEYLKLVLDDMTEHYGVSLLFHACLCEAERDAARVSSLSFMTVAGRLTFSADYVIDATGDATLAHLVGCPYRVGRESDEKCQPMTLCFRLSGVDCDAFFADLGRLNELWAEERRTGIIHNPRENLLVFRHASEGVLHFNATRVLSSPLDPFEKSEAERTARRQMLEILDFLKRHAPSCQKATLLSSASEIGVRESRMIKGLYTVTEDDILERRKFPDAIAAGNYGVDIHSPDGSGTRRVKMKDGTFYTIPYRATIPCGFDNLLVVGRAISSTHEAQSAYRIMPNVASIGEGAGIALALCHKQGIATHALDLTLLAEKIDAYDLVEREESYPL